MVDSPAVPSPAYFSHRHRLLAPVVAVLLLSTIPARAAMALESDGVRVELGPMLGHVGPDSARIWVRLSAPARLGLKIGTTEDLSAARAVEGPVVNEATDFCAQILVDGLNPKTRYFYSVTLDGVPVAAMPTASFVTAPPTGEKGRQRIAFTSCAGRKPEIAALTYTEMAERANADVVLWLGDSHYADSTDIKEQRAGYYAQRHWDGFKALTRGTPQLAIWDDHDFGPDDSDRTLEGKENVLRVFREVWANPSGGLPDDEGVYFKVSRGDIDIFMLDVRYHRDPNDMEENGKKTMLGERQMAWLKRELEASKASLIFIASGSEWQPNSHPDSWMSFARERDAFFKFLEVKKIRNVVLLSGDRHHVGAFQIRGKFIEVTSGPFGSKPYTVRNVPDMFMNHGRGRHYCVFDVDTSGPTPALTLEVYRTGDGLIDRRVFAWDEIIGKQRIPALPEGEWGSK